LEESLTHEAGGRDGHEGLGYRSEVEDRFRPGRRSGDAHEHSKGAVSAASEGNRSGRRSTPYDHELGDLVERGF
jgi:hypothetical protein